MWRGADGATVLVAQRGFSRHGARYPDWEIVPGALVPEDGAYAIAALTVLAALTFGAMALVGAGLTMAALAVLPVLIGLAVDYAIQLQSRVEEQRTAGHDGAAAVVLTSAAYAERHGLEVLATFRGAATAGVPPRVMGLGPLPATERLFRRLELSIGDIDLIELNEAFAAQSLAVIREWGLADDDARVNPNGGAIAIGHPLGCSGCEQGLGDLLDHATLLPFAHADEHGTVPDRHHVAPLERGVLLHGHVHHCYSLAVSGVGPTLFCAGSATYAGREGCWLFELDETRLTARRGRWEARGWTLGEALIVAS